MILNAQVTITPFSSKHECESLIMSFGGNYVRFIARITRLRERTNKTLLTPITNNPRKTIN